MIKRLPRGHFFGRAEGQRDVSGIIVLESIYPDELSIPVHEHAAAFFDLIVEGTCTEIIRGQTRARDRSSLAFHPAGEVHSSRWHGLESRCFHVEIPGTLCDRVREAPGVALDPTLFRDGTPVWLARRLYNEFRRMDDLSALAIEGLTLELLAECTRRHSEILEQRPPRWLAKVLELVHEKFREPLTLGSIAELAAIHPAHLTRVFRQFHRCTLGDYIRKLRIDFACQCLANSESPLVEIALRAGFSDQSHFSRRFKRQMGISPAAFRESVKPRKSGSRRSSDRHRN